MFSFITKSIKRRRLEKEGLAISKKRLTEEDSFWHLVDHSKWVSLLIFISLWIICSVFLLVHSFHAQEPDLFLIENQLAPKTIYADFSFTYLDQQATTAKRDIAEKSVPLMYVIKDTVCEEGIKELKAIISEVEAALNLDDPETAKLTLIDNDVLPSLFMLVKDRQQLAMFYSKFNYMLYSGIISTDESSANKNNQTSICVIDKFNHVRPALLLSEIPTPLAAAKIFADSVTADYSPQTRKSLHKAVYIIAKKVFRPNLFFDSSLTQIEREIVSSSPRNEVYRQISRGDVIFKKGDKITSDILDRYKAYEKERNKRIVSIKANDIIYQSIIAFLVIISLVSYIFVFNPTFFRNNNKLATAGTVIALNFGLIVVFEKIFRLFTSDYSVPAMLMTVSIPLSITPILVSSLIGLRAAAFSSMLVYLLVALRMENFYIIVLGLALSCFSVYFVSKSRNYKEFLIKSIITVPIVFIPAEIIAHIRLLDQFIHLLPMIVLLSVINGIITGALCLGFLFVFESVFKISTDMSLLSLCDYNHPLLKRLQIEAPGTYHHSLIVAILAEHAAVAIGASPVRARVCALFHDIGKLDTPEYFVENNSECYKKHDLLKPAMSSMIIMNHVKEGVNLALKNKLNIIIRDVIQQHHGTDLVYYFYKKAIDMYGEGNVSESEYRYPGPRPTKKEVVLVTLADVCEAASRTLEKPTPNKVETLVWEIIRKKIREGQLDNANLTFAELARAKESFIKTLNTMLHSRITYPVDDEKDSDEGDLFKTAKEQAKDSQKRNNQSGQVNT